MLVTNASANAELKKGDKKAQRPLLPKKPRQRKYFFNASHPHKLTSRQWIIFIMYCWGFFALGIFTSAPGPILPTLQAQVNVDLAIISFIFSARAIGFVIGSMISGYVMDRYQKFLIAPESGTTYLLQKKQKIHDYLWSLPTWNWWPLSAHNVFTISIIIAAITNAAIPYVSDVYSLAVLVSINGICFGNINTFGNVLLLTLFDTEISNDIDFDLVYSSDLQQATIAVDTIGKDDKDKKDDERQGLIEEEEEPSESYGALSRNDPAEATMVRMVKQEERVGPFMQFLQAIYALGGFLAPIFIQISFEISGGYAYSFWFFTILYIPPGIVLLWYPEPVRMSVISERLQAIEKVNRSTRSLLSEGATDGGEEDDPVAKLKASNKKFWGLWLVFGFAVFLLWYVGAQVGYGMYVTTYAIDYLNTSDAVGRYLASANWLGLFVGRFVAVPLSQRLSALNMV
eukprot:356302_1